MSNTTYPENNFLFVPQPQYPPVETFLILVTQIYVSNEYEFKVLRLAQLKLKSAQQHEKTLVELRVTPRAVTPQAGGEAHYLYIVTERGALVDPNSSSSSLFNPSEDACHGCCTTTQLIAGKKTLAFDRVAIPPTLDRSTYKDYIAQRSDSHIVLCQFHFNDSVSLSQLAVLLRTIHEFAPIYDAHKFNCYWYTVTLGNVLSLEFNVIPSENEKIDQRGKYAGLRWMEVPDSTVEVQAAYRAAWEKFEEKLKHDTGKAERLQQQIEQMQREQELERLRMEQIQREQEQERLRMEQIQREQEQERLRMEQIRREDEQKQLENEKQENKRLRHLLAEKAGPSQSNLISD